MHAIDKNDLQFIEERHGKVIGWVPGAQKKGKVNPQVTMAMLENGKFASVFHVKPVYYETSAGDWRPLSEVTKHHGNHKIEFTSDWWKAHPRYMAWLDKRMKILGGELLIPSTISAIPTPYQGVLRSIHESFVPFKIGLTTSTFYPDPNPETTTVDGGVASQDSDSGWTNVHDDTTGQYPNDDAVNIQDSGHGVIGVKCYGSANDFNIIRGFILFDTSSVPDTDTIDSATLSLYFNYKAETLDAGTNAYMTICSSSPASNTALVAGDFDNVGTTEYATGADITGISTSAYTDFSFNASGISSISKTGVSKYGLRVGHDILNVDPGFVANMQDIARPYSADQTGTSNDPKLVVVHTGSSTTFIPRISFIM